jgi:(E)-4-hydroxy-3-methylbut-2-enyl-diphosphate synthase
MAAPMMIPLEASRGRPGKINLYVGKTAVKFNIPEAEAVDRLVDLIQEHGKWAEPEESKSGNLATH